MRTKTKRDRLPIATPEILEDLIRLAGYEVAPLETLKWDQDTRDEVQEWAAREHLRASDNNTVRRRPLPKVLEGRKFCCGYGV